MAKQIEGVYEMVLTCARQEFLNKGFQDASLRTIAQEADTSTGSIYTRFGDKEGLFKAIVEPVAAEMKQMVVRIQETFHSFDADTQRNEMGKFSDASIEDIIDYIYDHFDTFCLLLDSAYGTLYQNFVNELVDIEVQYTYKYLQIIGNESVASGQLTEELMHIVTTAYMNGLFEVVRHGMNRETAHRYISMLRQYHRAGFETIIRE